MTNIRLSQFTINTAMSKNIEACTFVIRAYNWNKYCFSYLIYFDGFNFIEKKATRWLEVNVLGPS